jgi:undecaprenyl-diphosphatase
MNWWQAVLLGIVEGLTEFLPVSSTGHLILVSNALKLENSEFLKLFEIVIQTGAILAVIWIFFAELLKKKEIIKHLIVAFVPTAVIGLLAYSTIKKYFFSPYVVCSALFVGGIVLLFMDKMNLKEKDRPFTMKDYFYVGLFQCLAFIPGVSRSAATIIGARLLGANNFEAVKFSFLLAIPTIISASGYSMLKLNYTMSKEEWTLLAIGLVTSFVFGFLSVKVFLKFLNNKTFMICGIYRIVIAILYFWAFIL